MKTDALRKFAFAFVAASGLALATAAQAADQVAATHPGGSMASCETAVASTQRAINQLPGPLSSSIAEENTTGLGLQFDLAKQACANGDDRNAIAYLNVVRSQMNLPEISG
jgi:hypothetical protein